MAVCGEAGRAKRRSGGKKGKRTGRVRRRETHARIRPKRRAAAYHTGTESVSARRPTPASSAKMVSGDTGVAIVDGSIT